MASVAVTAEHDVALGNVEVRGQRGREKDDDEESKASSVQRGAADMAMPAMELKPDGARRFRSSLMVRAKITDRPGKEQ